MVVIAYNLSRVSYIMLKKYLVKVFSKSIFLFVKILFKSILKNQDTILYLQDKDTIFKHLEDSILHKTQSLCKREVGGNRLSVNIKCLEEGTCGSGCHDAWITSDTEHYSYSLNPRGIKKRSNPTSLHQSDDPAIGLTLLIDAPADLSMLSDVVRGAYRDVAFVSLPALLCRCQPIQHDAIWVAPERTCAQLWGIIAALLGSYSDPTH